MSIRQCPMIGDRVSVIDLFRDTIVFSGTLIEMDDILAIVRHDSEDFPCLPEELRKERRQ